MTAAAATIEVLLGLDAQPRFMRGDSSSCLVIGRTGVGSDPPDRSSIQGLAARGSLVATHRFLAQMLLHAALGVRAGDRVRPAAC